MDRHSQRSRLRFATPRSGARRLLPAALAIVACACAGSAQATAPERLMPRTIATPAAVPHTVLPTTTRAHIATWAIDDGCSGGSGAGQALVRQWVTFAESNCGPNATKAQGDCHVAGRTYCYVTQYMDTDWIYGDARVPVSRAAKPNWWLHEPAGHRRALIFGNQEGGGHLLNQTVPAVREWFRSYVRRFYNEDDALLMDDQSPSLPEELYYSTCHCRTTLEIHSNAILRSAHNRMSAALTHRDGARFLQADNTLAPNPFLPQGLNMLDRGAGVDGLIAEGEPEEFGTLDPYYSTLLDQIAYVINRSKAFVVPMSHGNAGAPSQPRSRLVQEATVLLGFSPGRMVDWADLEMGSTRLAVWPEEGIYPSGARESMHAPGGHGCLAGTGVVCSTGGHNDLEVAGGVYRREFRSCSEEGVAFGDCAAIVNTTGSTVTVRRSWLHQSYRHVITISGGDVQSGGTIDLSGGRFAAGRTKIAPHSALLISR
jgi:hypothetical protein